MKTKYTHQNIQMALQHFFPDFDSSRCKISYFSSSLFSLYICEFSTPVRKNHKEWYRLAIKKISLEDDIQAHEMANTELEGLQLLLNYKTRVPYPIGIETVNREVYLIMEFVEKNPINPESKKDLKISLKKLYLHRNLKYGHDKNNYIGSLLQINAEYKNFLDFWWESRISPMMRLAIEKGFFLEKHSNWLYRIIKKFLKDWNLDKDMPRPVHGDLWSGNIIFSRNFAYLIDPSFAYSHPVQDFAMLELFGSPLHFSDYQEIANECGFSIFPEMIDFFQIYPLLVHVNIFGASYQQGIMNFIEKYR